MLNIRFKNSKKLQKVLITFENILRKNKTENKLKYIVLKNQDNKLCISARNMETRIKYIVEDTIEINGDCTLYDYKMLISLLNVLDGEITIKDNVIKNDKCEYKIPITTLDEYPQDNIPDIENKKEINTQEFKDAIDGVMMAAMKSEYDYALSGIYIDENKLVAADNNRVFLKELTIDDKLDKVIMPKELVNELLRLPFNEKMYISLFGENIIFQDEHILMVCRTIAQKYPQYQALIPINPRLEITFNKKEFENALNLIMPVISEEKRKICSLEFLNSVLFLSAANGNKQAETSIDIQSNEAYDPFKVKFNVDFLYDMLKAHKEENIVIEIYENGVYGCKFVSEKTMQYIMQIIN